MTAIKLDKLVGMYVNMRDALKEREKAYKESVVELKANMEKLELHIKKKLDDAGIDSVKAGKHTAFTTMKDSVTIDDKEDFKSFLYGSLLMALRHEMYKDMEGNWQPDGQVNFDDHISKLMESDALDILTLSANKNSIKAYMDEHKGLLPEGIQYRQEQTIQIRKGK